MTDYETWFTQKPDGKYQINSTGIYVELYPQIVQKLDNNLPVGEIMNWIRDATKRAFHSKVGQNPETGAISNSLGRWNEFIATSLLCEIAIDIYKRTGKCVTIFSLPNSAVQNVSSNILSSNFLGLFDPQSLQDVHSIKSRIFFPSPDYTIALINDIELFAPVQNLMREQSKNPGNLGLYNLLKGKLKTSEVKAVVSLKTSNRPDRRYQPSFEAVMIKTLAHVLELNWKYYMVTSKLTPADKTLFEHMIAPHSIVTKQYANLVNAIYVYQRKADLVPLVEAAITL